MKERCWQNEPGASRQARSRRRGRARQPPEGQHFNVDAESCTLLGKGETEGSVVSVCSWRGTLQNYKCHYFALHLYLSDRNTRTHTHIPRWEIGAALITYHLQMAPRVLAGSGVHLACSIQTPPWPETSRHDQIQLRWEDVKGLGMYGKAAHSNIIWPSTCTHPGWGVGKPRHPFPSKPAPVMDALAKQHLTANQTALKPEIYPESKIYIFNTLNAKA